MRVASLEDYIFMDKVSVYCLDPLNLRCYYSRNSPAVSPADYGGVAEGD